MSRLRISILVSLIFATVLAVGLSQNLDQLETRNVAGIEFGTLPNFVVERVNPADKLDSYVVLTFDSEGRPVVSKEQDHPRTLFDNDGDGIYESEKVFTDKVENCQGLWMEGRTMYGVCSISRTPEEQAALEAEQAALAAAGGGRGRGGGFGRLAAGVVRMTDADGDDAADTFEVIATSQGGIGEHGPHAIRRAPDGSFSYVSGNNATIDDEYLDMNNSLLLDDKDGQFLEYLPNFGRSARQGAHSAVYRWDPKINKFTVLFGGDRNSYDHAYNLIGEAFLYDSDMEWDLNMPWYREVRTVHGIPGGNYGYRDGSGKYPPYYIDSLPPVRELHRGSPVGVEFYQSYTYPSEYFDNFFEGDWSRGRVLYTALRRDGATYLARDDQAEFIHGEPLNVTDMEVGPDGMLYFTTGGRNTEGGFWRVRYTGEPQEQPDMSGMLAVARQPQPLSSWGWAAIEQVKADVGASEFGAQLERLVRDTSADGMDRARSLYEMQRHKPEPSLALLQDMVTDGDENVRAAAVFAAGVQGQGMKGVAATALKDSDPLVRRRAVEALVRMGQSADNPSLAPAEDIYALLSDPDRFVRWSARIALERTPRELWKNMVLEEDDKVAVMESMLAWVRTAGAENLEPMLEKQLTLMGRTDLTVEDKLRLLRVFEYTTTEMEDGVRAEMRKQVYDLLAPQFPSQDERLNRELAMILAYTGQPGAIGKILAAMPEGDENQPLQLHYVYALRTIKQGWTREQKSELIDFFTRAVNWRGGAQAANFTNQMFEWSLEFFDDQDKELAYSKLPQYAPLEVDDTSALAAAAGGRGGGGGFGGGRGRGPGLSKQETWEQIVYVPQRPGRGGPPDPQAAMTLFNSECASCHRFGTVGNDYGPDLTNHNLSKADLLEAIFWPDRSVDSRYMTTVITTNNGQSVRGLVVGESDQSVMLKTAQAPEPIEVMKSEISSRTQENASIMPGDYFERLQRNDLSMLASFLRNELE